MVLSCVKFRRSATYDNLRRQHTTLIMIAKSVRDLFKQKDLTSNQPLPPEKYGISLGNQKKNQIQVKNWAFLQSNHIIIAYNIFLLFCPHSGSVCSNCSLVFPPSALGTCSNKFRSSSNPSKPQFLDQHLQPVSISSGALVAPQTKFLVPLGESNWFQCVHSSPPRVINQRLSKPLEVCACDISPQI